MLFKMRWGTLYLMVAGPTTFDRQDLIYFAQPVLSGAFEAPQAPAVYQATPAIQEDDSGFFEVISGPFRGSLFAESGERIISALKWNVRRRDNMEVTPEFAGQIRAAIRREVLPEIRNQGWGTYGFSFAPYGQRLSGDKGVPQTPTIPGAPISASQMGKKKSKIPWALAAIAGVLALANAS